MTDKSNQIERPKRHLKKKVSADILGLSWQEERELRRAMYESLKNSSTGSTMSAPNYFYVSVSSPSLSSHSASPSVSPNKTRSHPPSSPSSLPAVLGSDVTTKPLLTPTGPLPTRKEASTSDYHKHSTPKSPSSASSSSPKISVSKSEKRKFPSPVKAEDTIVSPRKKQRVLSLQRSSSVVASSKQKSSIYPVKKVDTKKTKNLKSPSTVNVKKVSSKRGSSLIRKVNKVIKLRNSLDLNKRLRQRVLKKKNLDAGTLSWAEEQAVKRALYQSLRDQSHTSSETQSTCDASSVKTVPQILPSPPLSPSTSRKVSLTKPPNSIKSPTRTESIQRKLADKLRNLRRSQRHRSVRRSFDDAYESSLSVRRAKSLSKPTEGKAIQNSLSVQRSKSSAIERLVTKKNTVKESSVGAKGTASTSNGHFQTSQLNKPALASKSIDILGLSRLRPAVKQAQPCSIPSQLNLHHPSSIPSFAGQNGRNCPPARSTPGLGFVSLTHSASNPNLSSSSNLSNQNGTAASKRRNQGNVGRPQGAGMNGWSGSKVATIPPERWLDPMGKPVSTHDFIDFLSYKGSPCLPPDLAWFATPPQHRHISMNGRRLSLSSPPLFLHHRSVTSNGALISETSSTCQSADGSGVGTPKSVESMEDRQSKPFSVNNNNKSGPTGTKSCPVNACSLASNSPSTGSTPSTPPLTSTAPVLPYYPPIYQSDSSTASRPFKSQSKTKSFMSSDSVNDPSTSTGRRPRNCTGNGRGPSLLQTALLKRKLQRLKAASEATERDASLSLVVPLVSKVKVTRSPNHPKSPQSRQKRTKKVLPVKRGIRHSRLRNRRKAPKPSADVIQTVPMTDFSPNSKTSVPMKVTPDDKKSFPGRKKRVSAKLKKIGADIMVTRRRAAVMNRTTEHQS